MSNFNCEHCGAVCSDTTRGYVTGCEHYPVDVKRQTTRRASFLELSKEHYTAELNETTGVRMKDGRNLEFEIGDLVLLQSHDEAVEVSGVVHDDQRLFVMDTSGGGKEWEVPFTDVVVQYTNKKI